MTKQNLRKIALLMSMSSVVLNQTDGAFSETEAARPAENYSEGGYSEAVRFCRESHGLDIDRCTREFEGKDVVAICGGTRVGKGTIINALLGIKYDVAGDSTLKPKEEQIAALLSPEYKSSRIAFIFSSEIALGQSKVRRRLNILKPMVFRGV